MKDATPPIATVDQYIAGFPPPVRDLLEQLRATIRAAAPDAVERISYQIPTYVQHGNLVHFGAYKAHIGFYPAPSGIAAFQEQLAAYAGTKATVRFPLDQPLPLELIADIVRFRLAENLARAESRSIKS